jgi:hypothetical protein
MLKKKSTFIKILLLYALSFSSLHAFGSFTETNMVNDLIGDRATGMGGAYAAVSDDPSGAFYNPAGLAFAVDNQISLSVNTYRATSITFEGVILGNNYNQQISSFYPSFFGVVQSVGDLKFAIVVSQSNSENLEQTEYYNFGVSSDNNVKEFQLNKDIKDSTSHFGAAFSGFLTSNISWGIYGGYFSRKKKDIQRQFIVLENNTSNAQVIEHQNSYYTDQYSGVTGRIGFQYMPITLMAFGGSFSYHYLLSHYRVQNSYTNAVDTTNYDMPTTYSGNTCSGSTTTDCFANNPKAEGFISSSEIPMNGRFGIAIFPNSEWLITADVVADFGTKLNYLTTFQTTINGAIGAEYYATPITPIRFGVFTNFASTPRLPGTLSTGDGQYANNIDLYGGSLSFSLQTRNSSVTLASFVQSTVLGKGSSELIDGKNTPVEVLSYTISLTGSARY